MSQKVAKRHQFPATSGYWNNNLTIDLNVLSKNITLNNKKMKQPQSPFMRANTKYVPINNKNSKTPQYPKCHKNNLNIIQCPNPTANPITNHQKQQQIQVEQKQHLRNANYVQQMEEKLNEQNKLIQNLMNRNNILSVQLTQQQNYIAIVENQNSTLLNAYNSVTNASVPNACAYTANYKKWNVDEVMSWLSKLENAQFAKYQYGFCVNNIDGHLLRNLTMDDLEKMGVANINDQS
eukprot:UN06093